AVRLYHTTLGSTTTPHFAPQQAAVYTHPCRAVKVTFCPPFSSTSGPGGRACRPPEEGCKPDSVPPPRQRGAQPFVWPPGCPGDGATDPRERAGHPRPAAPGSLLHGLAPGGVYRASALTSGPGELLPRRFTLATGTKPVAVCSLWHFPPVARG